MPTTETIIKNYTDFFAAGSKRPTDLKYGLEAEHFIVDRDSRQSIPYFGENGVLQLLNELKPHFTSEYWADGHLFGLINNEAELSLEPGSQLEISVAASADITELAFIYNKYHQIISTILAKRNQELLSEGYQPKTLVRDIPLLPKKRYTFMDQHFNKTGNYGINMMRGTASCQVVLDYTDEKDFINKYQCACLLAPLFAIISSNAPIFEAKPNDNPLIRTAIWRGVDPARCGIPPAAFDPDFSFRKYAEYIISQDAIFEAEADISKKSERKVSAVLSTKPKWSEEYLLYLSLVFPDVRLRQYIEIRVADSMPATQTFAYMALIKGLFLDMDSLNEWLTKFPRSINAITEAFDALMAKGLDAIVYGEPVTCLLNEMRELSLQQLSKKERTLLKEGIFLKERTLLKERAFLNERTPLKEKPF
ncbi:MAG: glutamate-cysteine ligase family protein [Lachnospiraceae bacterium]|nr:glutamate-cysteine ligase family protein [Lachnospiraceae bacterium]